ncbi:DUF599 domain-containing protein [Wenxinia marina]|uniref:Putative membrane protein n=1 Tax=Wenxinia marina DSM 24838 TaxID=1123501 RepID=A0A0D0P8S4_9RHOB|nr:DUF599 domain-containing protein [Wenxinia marina]KIQ67981.1 putative membrane protein [Wenxinia marina DSM 24838]GGL75658.1 membrane protein [Wenxinia marina]
MTLDLVLSVLGPYDLAALALLLVAHLATGWRIEHPGGRRPSVTVMMADHRRAWMKVFLTRDVRIFDSQILGTLRQGTSFFASTTLLSVGGVLALIGNPSPLTGAEGLLGHAPELLWQVRLLPVALLLAHAFLRFVWAHRLFGYCAVLMAAVPEDRADPTGPRLARIAGEINVRAAWNFNRGLRSMYFALGAMAWLFGAAALAVAVVTVVWVLWSREFRSEPHRFLMEGREG